MIVAIWSMNTQAMQHWSVAVREKKLKAAMDEAYKEINTKLPLTDKPAGIFVAPEYYFAEQAPDGAHKYGDQRHLSSDQKNLLLAELKNYSEANPGVVFIPGTIAWQKTLNREWYSFSTNPLTRQQKAIQALKAYPTLVGIAINDQLSGSSAGRNALTTNEKLTQVGETNGLPTAPTASYIGRNTAYVFLDGEILCKYNKKGDFHEVLTNGQTVHIPGSKDGRFDIKTTNTRHRSIRCGIEICLDHVYKTAARDTPHYGEPDIHIITSASVREREASLTTKKSGYLIHACSDSSNSCVKQRQVGFFWGDSFELLKPYKKTTSGECDLNYWEIELDLGLDPHFKNTHNTDRPFY